MKTKDIVLTAFMIAVGLVLPPIGRALQAGIWLSPMHIPAFLAGITVGPLSGLITGLLLPFLNNILFGMPQGATLIAMTIELPVYGVVSGLLMKAFKNQLKNDTIRLYVSLLVAMILGRIAGGLVHALVFDVGNYSLRVWASSYFIATAPGIVVHLIVVPTIYFSLKKAHLIDGQ